MPDRVIVAKGELAPAREATVVGALEATGLDVQVYTAEEFGMLATNSTLADDMPSIASDDAYDFGPYLSKEDFFRFRSAEVPAIREAVVGLIFNRLCDDIRKRSARPIAGFDRTTGELIIRRPLEPFPGITIARRDDVGLAPYERSYDKFTRPDTVLLDNHVIDTQSLCGVGERLAREPRRLQQPSWRFVIQLARQAQT